MTYSFDEISIQLNRWLLLPIICLGVVGNLVNINVFIRPVFNHHVCSWYFFTLAVNNCIYSLIVIMYRLLTDGFQIQALTNSYSLCQFISYMTTFCTSLSHYLIVLTAVDRYCASSADARRRKFNSFQIMPWSIFLIIIFCGLISISSPIITDLKSIDRLGCNIRPTTIFNQSYLIIQLILFVIIAPLLMTIFSLLIIQNKKLVGDRPMAVSKCRHMEHHLTQILLLLVLAHIILNLSEWIEYLILLRPDLFGPFIFIQTIIRIPIYFSHVLPIVWYLILGIEFRRELRKMIPILGMIYRPRQVHAEIDYGVHK